MRGLTKNLRVKVDEMPEEDPVSHNRTPPLEPESPIAPSTPIRSSPRNSNTVSGTPQSTSKVGRLLHNLKEDWEAGIDPDFYHAKRERERQAMNGSSGNAAGPSQPQNRNSSRGPERANSNKSILTQSVSYRRAAKLAEQDKREVRKLQREESQRKLVKHQRDLSRGYFDAPNISPKFAPLRMLQKANDDRIHAQEKERAHFVEMERRRNFDEWERWRETEERRRAHAPPGFQLPPPEFDGRNPYELRTRTAKVSQPSGLQRGFSFRNGPDFVGDSRPDSHRAVHEDPFRQPRQDTAEDSGPSSKGQNTYLYYRPEPQLASDPRLPSDAQAEYPACLDTRAEPNAPLRTRSPYRDSNSRAEEYQTYLNYHAEPKNPRSSCDSWEVDSMYSQTVEEEPARQGWSTNNRAAPQRPSTPERRGEHEDLRARLVIPGKTFALT